jgi:hypothetical protein
MKIRLKSGKKKIIKKIKTKKHLPNIYFRAIKLQKIHKTKKSKRFKRMGKKIGKK